jgi:hypothetical protein
MNKDLLLKTLKQYRDIQEKDILFHDQKVNNINYLKLREINYSLGELLEEDDDNQLYVTTVKSGFLNQNCSFVVTQLQQNIVSFAIYSKEGLIKQDASNEVLNLYINKLTNKNINKTKKKKMRLFPFVLLIVVCICGGLFIPKLVSLNKAVSATKEYNRVVKEYNELAESYNDIAKKSYVENIDGFLANISTLPTQSIDSREVFNSLFNGNSVKIIEEDIKTLNNMKSELVNKIGIASNLINPNEEWLINKLSNCSDISNIQAVTSEKDPNGLLGKEGGYTSAIYFTVNQINSDKNQDSIQLGTDGGGCVEVYENINNAQARCDYLSAFNNSILPTGSYAMIGTMVVRTSYQLDEISQYNLTDEIFESLTNN